MAWSFEEEKDAATFLRAIAINTNYVLRRDRELEYVETQLAKSQAGLTGEGELQTFTFLVRDKRMLFQRDFPITQPVDRRFINGMVKIAQTLRRGNNGNTSR